MNVTVVAKTVIKDNANKILVLRRSSTDPIRPGTWDLPGGSVEEGEDPTQAATRETLEEAGIEVQKLAPLYVCAENETKYVITIIYRAFFTTGVIRLSSEHDDFDWISPEVFTKIDIPEKYKRAMANL